MRSPSGSLSRTSATRTADSSLIRLQDSEAMDIRIPSQRARAGVRRYSTRPPASLRRCRAFSWPSDGRSAIAVPFG